MYKKIWLVLATLLGLIAAPNATPHSVHAEALHYAVAAQLPSNQINSSLSYFDLKVTPGTTQNLTIKVTNTDTTTHRFKIETNRAATNTNGAIDYSQHGLKVPTSLTADLEQMTSKPFTVSIPANTVKTLNIPLKVPATSFSGIVLGGIRVEQTDGTAAKTKSKGLKLNNRFAYVIGISLQENDQVDAVSPKMVLHRASAKQLNYRNYITAQLENTAPVVMHKLAINATVTQNGQKLLHVNKSDMAMSPNSNFSFPISTNNKPLQPGKYSFSLDASANGGKYHWHFDRNFTITKTQANKLNASAVDQQQPENHTLMYLLIAIGVVVLIGLIVLVLLVLRKPKRHA